MNAPQSHRNECRWKPPHDEKDCPNDAIVAALKKGHTKRKAEEGCAEKHCYPPCELHRTFEDTHGHGGKSWEDTKLLTLITRLYLAATEPNSQSSDTMFTLLKAFIEKVDSEACQRGVEEERERTIKFIERLLDPRRAQEGDWYSALILLKDLLTTPNEEQSEGKPVKNSQN